MSICVKIKETNDSIEQFMFDEAKKYVDLKLSKGDVHAARRKALDYSADLMNYFETETEKYKFFIIK